MSPDLALNLRQGGRGRSAVECAGGRLGRYGIGGVTASDPRGNVGLESAGLAAAHAAIEVRRRWRQSLPAVCAPERTACARDRRSSERPTGLPVTCHATAGVSRLLFMEAPAKIIADSLRAREPTLYDDFAMGLLVHGVLALPDGRGYVSTVHTEEDIDRTWRRYGRSVLTRAEMIRGRVILLPVGRWPQVRSRSRSASPRRAA